MKQLKTTLAIMLLCSALLLFKRCKDATDLYLPPTAETSASSLEGLDSLRFVWNQSIASNLSALTRSSSDNSIVPASVQPDWETSRLSSRGDNYAYDINTTIIRPLYGIIDGSDVVEVKQRVVIDKVSDATNHRYYLFTYIPTADCYSMYGDNFITNFTTYNYVESRFSGVILIHTLDDILIQVSTFNSGSLVYDYVVDYNRLAGNFERLTIEVTDIMGDIVICTEDPTPYINNISYSQNYIDIEPVTVYGNASCDRCGFFLRFCSCIYDDDGFTDIHTHSFIYWVDQEGLVVQGGGSSSASERCQYGVCDITPPHSPCSCCEICEGKCKCEGCHKKPCECRPCNDGENANPLKNLEIAPPSSWNHRGALFGETRFDGKGNREPHDGIDFKGNVGDPVFATHNGVILDDIGDQRYYVIEQPNTQNDSYPLGYKGDKNGAGNRIYIDCGDGIWVSYWHLQAGNPVAINPRTGEIFMPGDSVFIGDIIGYIGISGNAENADFPHLHYSIQKHGEYVDPIEYLAATIRFVNGSYTVNTPCD